MNLINRGLLDIIYNSNDNYIYISYAQRYSDKKSDFYCWAPININEMKELKN